jgi:penicillin-binding protein 1C
MKRGRVLAGIALALALSLWLLPYATDLPESLLKPAESSLSFTSREGQPLRQLLTSEGQRAGPALALDQIPKVFVEATLAAEDKRFFSHLGVDPIAIIRAALSNAKAGRVVSGASTITQQLIKISSRPERRNSLTKLREALRAMRLEREWTKEKILAAYLNRVPYGNLFTGCGSAASGYLNKPLSDLTPAEAAFLASLPQAPSRMNPFRDPKPALARQKRILALMHEAGWLSPEALQLAQTQEITLQRFNGGFAAPHALDVAGRELQSSDGPVIRTTLDASLQRRVETIIVERLKGLNSRHVTQAAAVVLENRTGHILALAGSRDFFSGDGGQINGAWHPHSPGSAVKPFTYQLAFEKGWTPASIIADLPIEFSTTSGTYKPENYDRRLYGPVTCRTALGNSLNISAVKVLQGIGGPAVLLERLRKLGLTTLDQEAEHYGLGLTIGNAPVRLLELTQAYATLARLGISRPWTLRADAPASEAVRLLGEAECFLIADILSDNQARLLTFGPHSPLRFPFPVAVKTGTSSTYRDNWTLGFTPEFTVGVWAGNFDNTPMQDVSGVTGAAPIFRDIFEELHSQPGTKWYETPVGVAKGRIDPRTGRRLTAQSPTPRLSRDEVFIIGTEPPVANVSDYEPQTGRAFLPPEFSQWTQSRDNWLGDLVTTRSTPTETRLRITHPIPGTVIRLDPDVPGNGSRLVLQADPKQGVNWTCSTLELQADGSHTIAILKPGRHEITAEREGRRSRTWVIVDQE